MPDIIQYAKFYTNLSELELKLNETANLGIHLEIDNVLSEKLIEVAEAIHSHIKTQADLKVLKNK